MTIQFILLVAGAYLLGALPVSYLAAKRVRGIDLRQYGTGQVGAGNLWRMTSSWKVSLPVSIFDFGKGALMVWVAELAGLDVAQGVAVGLATIIGHNWSVFLHFSGGRGVGTAIGLVAIAPVVYNLRPWALLAFVVVAAIVLIFTRSSPLPVLVGLAAVPLATWGLHQPTALALGFLGILLIIVIKRLTPRQSAGVGSIGKGQLLLNRLLFDRDIRNRKAWMYRKPAEPQEQTKGPGPK